MSAHCTKCHFDLDPAWSFCPGCGAIVAPLPHREPQSEHVPASGAYGGLLYGLVAAPILIIAGVMICLTGWGIFIGVPVMVLGVLAPLAGPLFGMAEHTGKCPACGTTVLTTSDGLLHDCPSCSTKFAVAAEHHVPVH